MALKVIWSPEALDLFREVLDYLDKQSDSAAARVGELILDRVGQLEHSPYRGSVYAHRSDGDVREILAGSYRVFYRVNETAKRVDILTIWHSARDEPSFP